jgi:hypothetical protein
MRPTTIPCLIALALAACTSLDAREPSKPLASGNTIDTEAKPDPKTEPKPKPPEPVASAVQVAIASVTLDQNCPDPEPPAPPSSSSSPASAVADAPPATPAKRAAATAPRPGEESPAFGYRRACAPSTLQLRFTNSGRAAASVRIASIQLHDVQSKSVLAPVTARLPAAFSDAGAYTPWDERLAAGAEFHASYRLTPPDWSMVESKLGGASSRGRELELEVTFEIDGKPVTLRSPAFSRPPEIIMPPT